MALLWCDGFESYGTVNAAPTGILSKYISEFCETNGTLRTGRDIGFLALELDSPAKLFTPFVTSNATIYAGFAFKLENTSVATRTILTCRIPSLDGSTIGYRSLDVLTTANTELYVNFNGTSIAATSGLGLTANTWYYLEFKCVCGTSGSVDLKIDGNSVANATSVNTRISSTYPFYSCVGFIAEAGQLITVDDFYLLDGSGSTNNDFLGASIVRDLLPTSDASGNWTANSAGNKYEEVDDATRDSTSFIYTSTTGNEQIFETTNQTLSGNIYGVMVTVDGQATGNITKGLKIVTQQGSGTINVGTNSPLPFNEVGTLFRVQELDPDGNTWNQTRLNGLRIGVRAG